MILKYKSNKMPKVAVLNRHLAECQKKSTRIKKKHLKNVVVVVCC